MLQKEFQREVIASHQGAEHLLIIGLFNGLMPCGPLQSMQIVALASANSFTGALSMFFFALGTIPLMLGFGSIVAGLGKHFTKQVLKCGAILVVVMGLSMMSQGTALSGMSSQINTLFSANGETAVKTSDRNDSDTDMEKSRNPICLQHTGIWSLSRYHC